VLVRSCSDVLTRFRESEALSGSNGRREDLAYVDDDVIVELRNLTVVVTWVSR
jgi:hypothetical protein